MHRREKPRKIWLEKGEKPSKRPEDPKIREEEDLDPRSYNILRRQ